MNLMYVIIAMIIGMVVFIVGGTEFLSAVQKDYDKCATVVAGTGWSNTTDDKIAWEKYNCQWIKENVGGDNILRDLK